MFGVLLLLLLFFHRTKQFSWFVFSHFSKIVNFSIRNFVSTYKKCKQEVRFSDWRLLFAREFIDQWHSGWSVKTKLEDWNSGFSGEKKNQGILKKNSGNYPDFSETFVFRSIVRKLLHLCGAGLQILWNKKVQQCPGNFDTDISEWRLLLTLDFIDEWMFQADVWRQVGGAKFRNFFKMAIRTSCWLQRRSNNL